jgi:hypothetical protein
MWNGGKGDEGLQVIGSHAAKYTLAIPCHKVKRRYIRRFFPEESA